MADESAAIAAGRQSSGSATRDPNVGCKRPIAPGASKIRLTDKPFDTADALSWQWTKGAATAFAELGTPPTTTDYLLCIYDESRGLVRSALAPADPTCAERCSTTTASGLKYKAKTATPEGPVGFTLKIGAAGKTKISLKGKGVLLPMPSLPMSPPVTVQLRNGAGACWEAVYGAPPLTNDSTRYEDKSD